MVNSVLFSYVLRIGCTFRYLVRSLALLMYIMAVVCPGGTVKTVASTCLNPGRIQPLRRCSANTALSDPSPYNHIANYFEDLMYGGDFDHQ